MRVLLIGGFGYLGGRLSPALAARGHHVIVAGRNTPRSEWLRGLDVVSWDALDALDIQTSRLRDLAPDTVIFLAALDENEAIRDPELAMRVSAEGTRRLLAGARTLGLSRFVFMSTFHVYGAQTSGVIDEDTPTKACHPYAIAHLAGEGFCRESNATGGTPAVILRMSNGYGCPSDLAVDRWTLAHHDFCRQALRDGRITLKTPGLQQRDFVWMDDVGQAVDLVLRAPVETLGERVFNLGGKNVIAVFALAKMVAERAERIVHHPVPIERPASAQTSTGFTFAIDRLEKLGFVTHDRLVEETDALLRRLAGAT